MPERRPSAARLCSISLKKHVMRSMSSGATCAALASASSRATALAASSARWPEKNASPLGLAALALSRTDMLSMTTCAPSISSAPTWMVLSAGRGCFFSVKVSLTMAWTRRMSPVPATNARSFTMAAPWLACISALSASRVCGVSSPLSDSGDT